MGEKISAYHDGELPVTEHHELVQHLQTCPYCRAEFESFDLVGAAMRRTASDVSIAIGHEPALHGLAGAVVSRVLAEQEQSWPVRMREAFDDLHLVWAGLSATAAVVVCAGLAAAIVMLGPTPERADSLRAMVVNMAKPGTDLEPLPLAPGMQAPRVSAEAITPLMLVNDLTLSKDEDVEMAISAVVTREGRISQTELLEGTPNEHLVQSLEDVARFQPASRAGTPVAVSLVWLVSHTTVRPDIIKPQSARRVATHIAT
ncbi:MAG TPA: zf-HC2 domain-containing protein [Luteitalea sp.]|nr:zf-HC2 domain-containing protein [Luteitalea sp.]